MRILRVARFAARYAQLGFRIAPETLELMRRITADGEVRTLVPERVWQETERALDEEHPEVYFQVLRDCGALAVIFPEVDALFGVPQPPRWHPEIDTGVHVLLALRYAAAHARLEPGALRGAHARSGQGADPEGGLAESPAARGIRGTADRGAVRAAAHSRMAIASWRC